MSCRLRKCSSFVAVAGICLLLGATSAQAGSMAHPATTLRNDASAESMVVDLVIVRPLMLVGTVAGALFYGLSLPFSASAGNSDEARKKLVEEPAYHFIGRPLGHLP